MKTGQLIALGVGGILVYGLLRKTTGLGNLVFAPGRVLRVSWQGMTPILVVELLAQNTSNQTFTVNSIAGNAFSDGIYIGNISSFVPVSIVPNSQRSLELTIRLQLLSLVNDIIEAVNTGSFTMDLKIALQANVDGLQVPIDLDFKLGA